MNAQRTVKTDGMRQFEENIAVVASILDDLRKQVNYLSRFHPDYNTPNWCHVCTPRGIGYCRCERASNE